MRFAPTLALVGLLVPPADAQERRLPPDVSLSSTESADDAAPDGLAAGDWTSIRAAYEAGRHSTHPVEGGYQARNPGQGWRTRFDGRGFTTRPDAGGWTWGLHVAPLPRTKLLRDPVQGSTPATSPAIEGLPLVTRKQRLTAALTTMA